MKNKARVIVTYDCNRNCQNCCNEHIGNIPQVEFTDLFKYEELIITGGEPMLIAPRVLEMIHRLRANNYDGKIWLYTASMSMNRWADKEVLKEVDGINYTLHFKPSINDLRDVCKLSQYILDNINNQTHKRSDRLLIDSRAWNNELLCMIGLGSEESISHWTAVKPFDWKNDDCPLAEGEELVFYDLIKE